MQKEEAGEWRTPSVLKTNIKAMSISVKWCRLRDNFSDVRGEIQMDAYLSPLDACTLSGFSECVCAAFPPHLLHSPQSHPLHQAPISCLMKGSPLLRISSRVSKGDKGGCWSNIQTNRQRQKHTFVARRLALISWLCQEPKREASPSLWTGAFQMRFGSLLFSHSQSNGDLCVQITASFAILLHK